MTANRLASADEETLTLADINAATGVVAVLSEDEGRFHENTEAFLGFLRSQPAKPVGR